MSTIYSLTQRGGAVKTMRTRVRVGQAAMSALVVLVISACGGGNTPSGGGLGSGDLLVGVLAPFSGADAGLGPAYYAACLAAAPSINNNGGVGGRQVKCQQFDTRGEPADAVPAANQMVASNSNLMAVIGCTSDEASTVAPIVDNAHIPMFCMTGQTEFNKTKLQYFHRLVPGHLRRVRDGGLGAVRPVPRPLPQGRARVRQRHRLAGLRRPGDQRLHQARRAGQELPHHPWRGFLPHRGGERD